MPPGGGDPGLSSDVALQKGGAEDATGESHVSASVGTGGSDALQRRIPPWRCRCVMHCSPHTLFFLWVKALDPATRSDGGGVLDVVLPPWWRLSSKTLLHAPCLRVGVVLGWFEVGGRWWWCVQSGGRRWCVSCSSAPRCVSAWRCPAATPSAHRCHGVVSALHNLSNVPPTQVVSWRCAVSVMRCPSIASMVQCCGLVLLGNAL